MFRRRRKELDEELRAHLEMAKGDRIARGETVEAADASARREFGNIALVREITREMWGWARLERVVHDLRYGLRLLRRSPTFATVAIASLTLGIGATAAVFSVLDAVRLRPLPVPRPHELVEIRPVSLEGARGNFHGWRSSLSNPLWEQIRDHQQVLSGAFAYGEGTFNLTTGGEARWARGLYVSGSYFDVLGIVPQHGRLFSAADDQRGCPPRVVISHGFWQREFGGDPGAIGGSVTLNSVAAEIVGVAPARFAGVEVGRAFDVAVPICAEPAIDVAAAYLDSASNWWLVVMGRLRSGVTIDQANAHFNNLSSGIFRATLAPNYPSASIPTYLAMTLEVLPAPTGVSYLRETYATSLWVLLGLAGLVLLLTCTNLANLLLARASAREGEIALRLGLGASRGRVVLQFLSESVILAAAGALGGLALAQMFSGALVAFVDGAERDIVLNVGANSRLIIFTVVVATMTTILFGLLPALGATRHGPALVLKRVGRTLSRRESPWVRRGLAVAQVAISLVLLFGALLFTRTLKNLSDVNLGFDHAGVVLVGLDLRPVGIASERRVAYQQEIITRLHQIPGVEGVASTSVVPLSGSSTGNNIIFDTSGGPKTVNMLAARVSDDYFETFQIPLLAGRTFNRWRDTQNMPRVAIVNQTLAAMFDDGQAVGRRFRVEATTVAPVTEYEIVGVVADSKYLSLRQEPYPTVFSAHAQDPRPFPGLRLAVRTRLEPSAITPSIIQSLRELHPSIGVTFIVLDEAIDATLVRERLMAALSSYFGSAAAALAVIGLYGLFAYTVVRRTNEIGVRMALGASRGEILRMVLRDAATLVGLGLASGIVLAMASGRLAESLLYGLEPRDPASIAAAAAVLGAIGLLASYLPARRAARIEPLQALRAE